MQRFIAIFLAAVFLLFTSPLVSSQKKGGKRSSKPKIEQTSAKKSSKTKGKSNGGNTTSSRTETQVKADKSQINKSIKQTQQQLKQNALETSRKLSQLNLVEGEIDVCNGKIGIISSRLDSINAEMNTVADSISTMDEHLKKITATYVKSVKRSQGKRGQKSNLAFIFSADSFRQAYRRSRYVKQLGKWREKRGKEILAARTELEKKKARLQVLADDATKSKNELSTERRTLLNKQSETEKLVAELRSQGAALRTVMDEQRAKAAALERELDAVIAREAAKREAARKAEEAARAEKARKEAEAKAAAEEARRQAEQEAARKAAEAEAARKAEEVRKAEAARKAAEEEAARKEAEAEKARQEAEKAQKAAKKEAEKKAAAQKAAEAEAKKKAAEEAKKAARQAEEEAKKQQKEQKEIEERRKKASKQKPVKHGQKGTDATKDAGADGKVATGKDAGTLKTPASSSESGTASKAVETASDFAALKGRLPFPITGNYTIVKKFGRQKHPSLPHVETDNAGIDLETAKGGAVRSVAEGEVSAVFKPDGYNSVVVIRHGGYMTVYANLGSVSVSTGQKVKAGQNIGSVYSDPNDNGRSVLHFEVRNGRAKENPELWLKR